MGVRGATGSNDRAVGADRCEVVLRAVVALRVDDPAEVAGCHAAREVAAYLAGQTVMLDRVVRTAAAAWGDAPEGDGRDRDVV
ncbi:hypothetical protein FDG2_4233 [Candidatus Protofrankia californiensis]|uniref:Uncharacterized protein n=1 Tax=Candidatus Protofrankia californiensis TaxID=1839754 RepID=A0A1C3P484_9ACTN|nr:hypothetical protein FDG2_4233 [Candidatus Protofrankia californiensis]